MDPKHLSTTFKQIILYFSNTLLFQSSPVTICYSTVIYSSSFFISFHWNFLFLCIFLLKKFGIYFLSSNSITNNLSYQNLLGILCISYFYNRMLDPRSSMYWEYLDLFKLIWIFMLFTHHSIINLLYHGLLHKGVTAHKIGIFFCLVFSCFLTAQSFSSQTLKSL